MPVHDSRTNDVSSQGTSNLLYAAAYAGFVGSGVLAMFFLLRDSLLGSPLLTPSILGAALFGPGASNADAAIRIDWVALASLVHVTLFTGVGAPFAYLVHRVEPLRDSVVMMSLGLFAVLGIGIVSFDALVTPGLLASIGPLSILLGNALTSSAMAVFYVRAFADEPVPAEIGR
ncbi:MAG: hypothetical protein HKN72_08540 [Gemmatimonadetes bacterium]|nr:hypothetical protein [Gemmatimonadota bacterium]